MLLFQEKINAYGIDWDGPLPEEAECDETVDVPEVPGLLVTSSVDPLQRSEVYGIDLYVETKQTVHDLLNSTSVSAFSRRMFIYIASAW